jgi:competence protein ComEA
MRSNIAAINSRRDSMLPVSARKILLSIQLALLSAAVFSSQSGVAQSASENETAGAVQQVNINEADANTIADILIGVGASRATAIVQYREEHGRFTSPEQLLEVKGIGESTLMDNREKILIE